MRLENFHKSVFLLLVFVYWAHNAHCSSVLFSFTFSFVLGGASSPDQTNLPASAIKYILISNCTDPGLYIATPPSGWVNEALSYTRRTDCSGEVQIQYHWNMWPCLINHEAISMHAFKRKHLWQVQLYGGLSRSKLLLAEIFEVVMSCKQHAGLQADESSQ